MQALRSYLLREGISHRRFARMINAWLAANGSELRVGKSAVTFWCNGDRQPRQTVSRAIINCTNNEVTAADCDPAAGADLFDQTKDR